MLWRKSCNPAEKKFLQVGLNIRFMAPQWRNVFWMGPRNNFLGPMFKGNKLHVNPM